MKNIPIPLKQHYLRSLMERVETLFQDEDGEHIFLIKQRTVNNMNFGFKLATAQSLHPPQHELLPLFECDLYHMIRSISFKPVRSDFQKKPTENINNMKLSENLLIFAGKTTNLYEMTP